MRTTAHISASSVSVSCKFIKSFANSNMHTMISFSSSSETQIQSNFTSVTILCASCSNGVFILTESRRQRTLATPHPKEKNPLRLVHTNCGNGKGKNELYWTLWVEVAFAAGLHVNTSIASNVTHSSVAVAVVVAAVSVNRPLESGVAFAQCKCSFHPGKSLNPKGYTKLYLSLYWHSRGCYAFTQDGASCVVTFKSIVYFHHRMCFYPRSNVSRQ